MRNRVYAVIDTNVLVSALIAKDQESYPLNVLDYAYSGRIVPLSMTKSLKNIKLF